MTRFISRALAVASLSGLLVACGTPDAGPDASFDGGAGGASSEEELAPRTEVARVELPTGVSFTFYADDEGGLTVRARAVNGGQLPDAFTESASVQELYTRVTGREPPQAMLDAIARAGELSDGLTEEAPLSEDDEPQDSIAPLRVSQSPGITAHEAKHTPDQFADEYCFKFNGKYESCQTNRTCNTDTCVVYQYKSGFVRAIFNAIEGDFNVDLYRTNTWGNYKLRDNDVLKEGDIGGVWDQVNWARYQKVKVTSARGDLYHRAIDGG